MQCQTTIRTTLKSSPNESINHLWKLTKNHTNIQYDQYSATKEVIKSFRDNQENKLTNQLTSQGSFFSSISKFSMPQVNTIWSTCQSKLPKNIFNFTVRYINNSLPNSRNLQKWGLTSSFECSFCLQAASLLHVVAGCSSYLDRFTWRHSEITKIIKRMKSSSSACPFDQISVLTLKNCKGISGIVEHTELLTCKIKSKTTYSYDEFKECVW